VCSTVKLTIQKKELKSNIDPYIHEEFIELMCNYEPELVLRYLQSNSNYRLDQALAIVRPKELIHATSYLLERMGDVLSAFKLLCDDLNFKVSELSTCYSQNIHDEEELGTRLVETGKALQASMRLCQRTSQRLESEDREAIWFPLLEAVMAPQRNIKDTHSDHFLVFKEFTKDVLMNMMSYISLPAVLQKIMQDRTYNSGKFGEIKDLILGMLDTYNYELTLLKTTNNLLGKDLHGQYYQEKKILTQGFSPSTNLCYLCGRTFSLKNTGERNEMILFRCGHVYHHTCLQGSVGYDEELMCVECSKNSVIHTVGYRRTSTRSSESSKTTQNKGKKSSAPPVYLSTQQEAALGVLWSQETKNSKLTDISPVNAVSYTTTSRYGKSNNIKSNPMNNYFDESFTLRLAPPLIQKGLY